MGGVSAGGPSLVNNHRTKGLGGWPPKGATPPRRRRRSGPWWAGWRRPAPARSLQRAWTCLPGNGAAVNFFLNLPCLRVCGRVCMWVCLCVHVHYHLPLAHWPAMLELASNAKNFLERGQFDCNNLGTTAMHDTTQSKQLVEWLEHALIKLSNQNKPAGLFWHIWLSRQASGRMCITNMPYDARNCQIRK